MAPKKQKIEEEEDEDVEETDDDKPVSPSVLEGALFINPEKLSRAKGILALINGTMVPKTESDADRRDSYSSQLTAAEVNPKGKDALRYVYETLLGGLVRTQDEQQAHKVAVAKAKSKQKKKRIEE